MPRFFQANIQNVQKLAIDRLTKVVAPRSTTSESKPELESNNESSQLLVNPPAETLKPIIRTSILAISLIGAIWWLTKPSEITTVQNLPGTSVSVGQDERGDLGQVMVHVTGDVVQPGVVTLPAGSRVIDAIKMAGGLLPNISDPGINLAAIVEDGQLLVIGGPGEISTDNRINLNSATLAELDTLPGVGPVMAQRILDWRQLNNSFSSINELQEVEGIGPKLFSRIKDLVRI